MGGARVSLIIQRSIELEPERRHRVSRRRIEQRAPDLAREGHLELGLYGELTKGADGGADALGTRGARVHEDLEQGGARLVLGVDDSALSDEAEHQFAGVVDEP